MDDGGLFQKIDGWLAAMVAALANLLLLGWIKLMGGKTRRLEARIASVEENKASATAFAAHVARNDQQVAALFKKIDDVHTKIDDSRKEIKGDIKLVADLVRNGKT